MHNLDMIKYIYIIPEIMRKLKYIIPEVIIRTYTVYVLTYYNHKKSKRERRSEKKKKQNT